MKRIINLTPHPINMKTVDGENVTIEPSGMVARVSETRVECQPINGTVPVTYITYDSGISGLPEPEEGTIYVVSSLVLQVVGSRRADVFAPGPAIRDDAGRVVGCDGLSCGVKYAVG